MDKEREGKSAGRGWATKVRERVCGWETKVRREMGREIVLNRVGRSRSTVAAEDQIPQIQLARRIRRKMHFFLRLL